MIVFVLVSLINLIMRLIWLLLIVHIVLSFFMSPYHPIRETVDRVVAPMLNPIRRIMPNTGMFDFSPVVLLILVELIGGVLRTLLLSL